MNTPSACLACFRRGVAAVIERSADSEERRSELHRLLDDSFDSLLDLHLPPPIIAARLYRVIAAATGVNDPYRTEKIDSCRVAHLVRDAVRSAFEAFPDRFEAAVRLAVSGNIFDVSVDFDLDSARRHMLGALTEPLDADAVSTLHAAMARADRILYILDNCGETVFDRLLVDLFPGKITLVVRGKPTLNDVTSDDLEAGGLGGIPFIDTGSDIPGVWLPETSEDFRRAFTAADLIVSKGQGNFETLGDYRIARPECFFLLRAKCPVIIHELGDVVPRSMRIVHDPGERT